VTLRLRYWSFRDAVARRAAALAAMLSYRRQELAVVAILAGSILAGFGVDAWHRRAPALLERLEAEPPRLGTIARVARAGPGPRADARPATPPRKSAPRDTSRHPPPPAPPPSAEMPLDVNAAVPADLIRLPGIGPRLAGRIMERRDQLGGRFRSFEEFVSTPGLGSKRAERLRPVLRIPDEPPPASPAPPERPANDAPEALP
jgi:hypothetical protein